MDSVGSGVGGGGRIERFGSYLCLTPSATHLSLLQLFSYWSSQWQMGHFHYVISFCN